ncbi:MAG: TlpA family protein disulfide reductase [Planctomycetes bacterium]|nr:TlpA family protein disulfide reductase [Planctomycetota bacterium]
MTVSFPKIIRQLFITALVLSNATFASNVHAGGDIPDDWFFEGANRPKALRALEGKPAPEIVTQAWIGDQTTIAANRGKVVVVDFWATWCGPCMNAIPENVELVKKSVGKPLAFIGIHDSNSGWNNAPQAVKSKGINYPVAQDKGDSAKAYQVSFWPTYVVIDHEGIVRAAGLIPTHVAEVVEMLLKKVPVLTANGSDSSESYFGGAARPSWLKAMEGTVAPALPQDAKWIGTPVTAEACKNQIVVMQFFSAQGDASMKQLQQVAELATEFTPQGVVIMGICDARSKWPAAKTAIEGKKIIIPVMQDGTVAAVAGSQPPIMLGTTAAAMGVRLAPTTVIIDRNGKVRAAGVRPDKVKEMINTMLTEPLSAPTTPSK